MIDGQGDRLVVKSGSDDGGDGDEGEGRRESALVKQELLIKQSLRASCCCSDSIK